MLPDFNLQEQKQLDRLKSQLDNALNHSNMTEQLRLIADYGKKCNQITRNAEMRETKYFTEHTDELAERLEREIEIQIVLLGNLQIHHDFQAIYQDNNELKKYLTAINKHYLDILQEHDNENYQRIIAFIEVAVICKNKITQAGREKLESKPTNSKDKDTEKAVARRAKELIAPCSRLSKNLFDTRVNSECYQNTEFDFCVGEKGKEKKPVTILVSINIKKLKGVSLSNGVMLNPFNRANHNIAVSLYVAGNTHITPRMIYEAMNGYNRIHKPPEQMYKAIMDSMEKLMYTGITIDTTHETEEYGTALFKFKGYLLPVVFGTAEINGHVVECFKFLDEPPLYTYAKERNQISSCEINLLAADLYMTPENVVIRDYLLEQITTMQSKKAKRNTVIRYDTLFAYLGITAPTEETLRAKKRDIRAKVRTILNAWVREKFIKGYEQERENGSIAKIRIFLA